MYAPYLKIKTKDRDFRIHYCVHDTVIKSNAMGRTEIPQVVVLFTGVWPIQAT